MNYLKNKLKQIHNKLGRLRTMRGLSPDVRWLSSDRKIHVCGNGSRVKQSTGVEYIMGIEQFFDLTQVAVSGSQFHLKVDRARPSGIVLTNQGAVVFTQNFKGFF